MTSSRLKSYAKVNLGLKILNKRPDNFHNIASIFIRIDLHDVVELIPSKEFSFICNNKNISTKNNTVVSTCNILNEKYNMKKKFKIILHKYIPLESGLGGGSSNAATILSALNEINNLKLSTKEMISIGKEIGSDVPFFINGGTKFVTGIGDIIKNHPSLIIKQLTFLLIFPKFSISTKWAYKNIKNNLHNHLDSYKFPALDEYVDWKLFDNDFEKVVGSAYPEIFEIKEVLLNNGALYSGLSGSGSTMFGIYNNKQFILEAQNKLKHYNTLIVSPT
tara:strand:+ start:225 stop:1055 length:831 start_codon:yes stop_codon:yes gene_type:complete